MKRETKKEVGKYSLDISKIFFAIGVLAPLIKENEKVSVIIVTITLITALIGILLINQGVLDE